MNLKRASYSLSEILYCLFLALMLGAKGMGLYDGQTIHKIVLLISISLVTIKIIFEEHTMEELLTIIGLFLILCFNYCVCRDKGLLMFYFMMFGLRNVEIKKIYKIGALTLFITMITNSMLAILCIHTGPIILHNRLGGEIIRYSLGSTHPNILQFTYFILSCFVLLYFNETSTKLLRINIILFIGSIFIFIFAVSFTSFILSLLLFIITTYYSIINKKLYRTETTLCYIIFSIIVSISIFIPFIVDETNPLYPIINKLLHYRLELFRKYYSAYPVTLFGNNIYSGFGANHPLDNSYISLLLKNGIILFSIIIIFFFCTLAYLQRKNRKLELFIFILIALAGFTEASLFNTSFRNIIFIWCGIYFYDMQSSRKYFSLSSLISKNEFLNKTIEIPNVDPFIKTIIHKKTNINVVCIIIALSISIILALFIQQPTIYGIPDISTTMFNDSIEDVTHCQLNEYIDKYGFSDSMHIFGAPSTGTYISFVNSKRTLFIEKMRLISISWLFSYILIILCSSHYLYNKKN